MSIDDWKITRVVTDGVSQMQPDYALPAENLLFERQWDRNDEGDWVFVGSRWNAVRDVEITIEGPASEILDLVVNAYDERGQYMLGLQRLPGSGVRKFELRGAGYFFLTVLGPTERLSVVKEEPCKG